MNKKYQYIYSLLLKYVFLTYHLQLINSRRNGQNHILSETLLSRIFTAGFFLFFFSSSWQRKKPGNIGRCSSVFFWFTDLCNSVLNAKKCNIFYIRKLFIIQVFKVYIYINKTNIGVCLCAMSREIYHLVQFFKFGFG